MLKNFRLFYKTKWSDNIINITMYLINSNTFKILNRPNKSKYQFIFDKNFTLL